MKEIIEFFAKYKGESIGGMAGFLFAVLVLTIGFVKTIFLVLCTLIGVFIGGRYFEKKKLIEFLDKHLPW